MNDFVAKKLLHMTQEGYELIADQFDKTRQHPWDDFSVFDGYVKDGMRVLDMGCGNGRLFSYLKKRCTISYIGIDQNPKFTEIAKSAYTSHPMKPEFYTASILDLKSLEILGSQTFDIIFCIAVLHHIPTHALQLQALKNMRRFLRVGGILCMENWNMWRVRKGKKTVWGSFFQKFISRVPKSELGLGDLITKWKSPQGVGSLYYHAFTIAELHTLLRNSGFAVEKAYYIRDGKPAHWWNGKNIVTIASKSIL